ncbi:hypothetical protein EGW08_012965, partial [Elysia chlorotica]
SLSACLISIESNRTGCDELDGTQPSSHSQDKIEEEEEENGEDEQRRHSITPCIQIEPPSTDSPSQSMNVPLPSPCDGSQQLNAPAPPGLSLAPSITAHSGLTLQKHQYTWRIDLSKTEKFWKGWFEGLSQKFLSCPVPKMLILAGPDRLDKDLMIGQMQGKFQLNLLPQCGHAVHEDLPGKVADILANFMLRHRVTEPLGIFESVRLEDNDGQARRSPVVKPHRPDNVPTVSQGRKCSGLKCCKLA